MNTGLKIVLIVISGLIIFCMAGLLLFSTVVKYANHNAPNSIGLGTEKAQELAAEMVDFEAPADMSQPYGFRMGDYSLLTYTGSDGHSHIYFLQIPEDSKLSKEELLSQAQKMSGGTIGVEFDKAESMEAVIMDQPVTVWLIDGINSANQPYRQAVSIFSGRNGTMMVAFERPMENWDEAELLQFLASIQ